jgi:hypothetical protein
MIRTKKNAEDKKPMATYKTILVGLMLGVFICGAPFAYSAYSDHRESKALNGSVAGSATPSTQKPDEPNNTTSSPSSNTQKTPASGTNTNQQQANAYAEEARQLAKCNAAQTSAYSLFTNASNFANSDFTNRTKGVYNDQRLNLQQMQSIVNYNITKKNNAIAAAYATYRTTMTAQGCSPVASTPSYQSTVAGYPELTVSYPYLTDYPYVNF